MYAAKQPACSVCALKKDGTGKHSVSLTYDLSANALEAFATGFAESYNEPIRKRQLTSTPSEAQSKVMLHTQLDS